MAAQQFRSAFHGFNREDVGRYIEYLNNQHKTQIDQLNNQLQTAKTAPANDDLQAQLNAALEKCAQLEAQLAAASVTTTEQELQAYRRAERTERIAQERAQQIRTQANAVLADATVKAEAASAQIAQLASQTSEQLEAYQNAVIGTQALFQDVVAALYSITPEDETYRESTMLSLFEVFYGSFLSQLLQKVCLHCRPMPRQLLQGVERGCRQRSSRPLPEITRPLGRSVAVSFARHRGRHGYGH